jgi:hypothetical protein
MSERYAASIKIGGEIRRSRLPELLEAIRTASVSHEWGDACFEPTSTEDLVKAIRDGHLFLCDDETLYGEFPELEAACRKLRLPYTRWSEGYCEYDAEIVEWRRGMKKPLIRVGSNSNNATFVSTEEVRKALQQLESNHIGRARRTLRALCPDIPKLPPFKIV